MDSSPDETLQPSADDERRPASWLSSVSDYVSSLQIRMEVVILAISICDTCRIVTTPTLMMAKVKRSYEAPPDLDDKVLKQWYTKKMIYWEQMYEYVNIPIAILATILLGVYSDKRGRKLPMILGLLGMLLGNAVYMLSWWKTTDISLDFVFLAAVCNGLTGGFRMVTASVNSYLSDQYKVKTTLSVRMITTYTILNLGDLIGSQMAKHVSNWTDEMVACMVMQITNLAVIFYVIYIVPSMEKHEQQPFSIKGALVGAVYSTRDVIRVCFRQREKACRAILLLALTCGFLNRLAFSEEKSLIGTYTKLKPFEWETDDYATYKSYRPFVQILGLLVGLLFFQRFLKLPDTIIFLIAILSMATDACLIGLAQSSAWIYYSLGAGFLHALVNPLLYTLLSCVVDARETGRVFGVNAILDDISIFVRTATLQNIYTATVEWYQGFIWFVLSGMGLISASLVVVIHVLVGRNDRIPLNYATNHMEKHSEVFGNQLCSF